MGSFAMLGGYGPNHGYGGSGGSGGWGGIGPGGLQGGGSGSGMSGPGGGGGFNLGSLLSGLGSGAGGGGGSSYQPASFTSTTSENPQLAALRGEMSQYQQGLASGQDTDARNAMGRQRDVASGYAKEGLGQAQDRGFGSDTGVAQKYRMNALNQGQQASAGLNAALTSDARKRQLDVLQGRAGLEATQAGITQGQQNFALNTFQANQQAQQAAAQLQAVQQQNNFQNQLGIVNAARGFFTGF